MRKKQEILDSLCHISNEEIEKDIRDTEAEITVLYREIDGLRMIGDKMSVFRADGKQSSIIERENFINKLKAILEVRKDNAKS